MTYKDIRLTRSSYNSSSTNKKGNFMPPLGVLRDFGITDASTITDEQLDKIFEVYKKSAFNDIDDYNNDRPLPLIGYEDLSENYKTILDNALIAEINNYIENGSLTEKTSSSASSAGQWTQTIDVNTRITPLDQIDTDTEQFLKSMQYDKWRVKVIDGQTKIFIGEQEMIYAKTANMIALSSLTWEGLDANDRIALGKQAIIKLINTTVSSAREFVGTWNAATIEEANNIETIFNSTGLTLTNGEHLTPATTKVGATILVIVASDSSWRPEEAVFDGTNLIPITSNNAEKYDYDLLKNRMDYFEFNYVQEDSLPNFDTFELAADAANARALLQNQINQNETQISQMLPRVGQVELAARDYLDNKSNFVLLSDMAGNTIISFGQGLPIIASGANDVKVDLSTQNLSQLQDGSLAEFVLSNGFNLIYLKDVYNDAASTSQNIQGYNFELSSSHTELVTSNLSGQSIPNLQTNWIQLQVANNQAVATISLANPSTGSAVSTYKENEDVTIEFTNAFGTGSGGIITIPWGVQTNGLTLKYKSSATVETEILINVLASTNGIVITFPGTTERTAWTNLVTNYPFLIKQNGITSLKDILIANYKLIKIIQLKSVANAGIDSTARASAQTAKDTADAALLKATTNEGKIINPNLLQPGKKYIIDYPTGATKPVYYEFIPPTLPQPTKYTEGKVKIYRQYILDAIERGDQVKIVHSKFLTNDLINEDLFVAYKINLWFTEFDLTNSSEGRLFITNKDEYVLTENDYLLIENLYK